MADSIGSVGVVLSADIAQFTSDMGKAALVSQREMASVAQAQQQADRQAQKFIQTLKDEAATFGKTREEVLKYRAEQLGMTQQSQQYIDAIAKARKEQEALGHGLEHVGFQSAGAKRELLVLAHELSQGNYSRFAGSLMVIGERTNIMSLAFSGAGLAALVAAGSIAGFVYEVVKGHLEYKAFINSLNLTSNAAGVTRASFEAMAQWAANASGATVTAAKEMEQSFVSSGQVGADTIQKMTTTALLFQRATGTTAENVVKDFLRMSDGVTKWAEEYNKQYHFLTAAQFEHIRALEEQGQKEQAEAAVLDALSGHIAGVNGKLVEQVGLWKRITSAVSEAMKAYGAPTDPLTQAHLQYQYATNSTSSDRAWNPMGQARYGNLGQDAARENLRFAQRAEDMKQEAAQTQARVTAARQASIEADGLLKKLREETDERAKVNAEIEKYRAAIKAKANDPDNPVITSAAQQAREEAAIRAKYNRKGIRAADTLHEQGLSAEIKDLQGQYEHEERVLKGSLDKIKADYDEGLLNTKQFLDKQYEAKQAAIERELVIVRQQEEVARGKKNIAAAEQYKNEEKKLLDQIEVNFTEHANAVTKNAVKAQQAVTAYIESLNAQYGTRQNAIDDSLGGIGLSGRQQAQQKLIEAARREYDQKAESLRKQHAKPQAAGGLSDEDFKSEMDALKAYYAKRVAQEQDFNAKSDELRADWVNGEKKALAEYLDSTTDSAGQTQKVFTDAMSGMEDSLVEFVKTGKLNFKSLADSIIADLTRIVVKEEITGPLAKMLLGSAGGGGGGFGGLLGALFGGGSGGAVNMGTATGADMDVAFAGAFADGGNIGAGEWATVGENGPERIYASRGGGVSVAPNQPANAAASSGGDFKLTLVNQTSAPIGNVIEHRLSDNERAIIIQEATRATAGHLYDANSPISKAMNHNYSLRRNR